MINIQIHGRFKIYEDLVVINREIWQLATFSNSSKRTKPMRKLKYYKHRNAYGYNRGYKTKAALLNLFYPTDEIINKKESNNF